MINNDTILILSSQYKIITDKNDVLDIGIVDKSLIKDIENANHPVFKIELGDSYIIAKGNDFLRSSVPDKCDYFYPLKNNKVFFNGNTINLRKNTKARK